VAQGNQRIDSRSPKGWHDGRKSGGENKQPSTGCDGQRIRRTEPVKESRKHASRQKRQRNTHHDARACDGERFPQERAKHVAWCRAQSHSGTNLPRSQHEDAMFEGDMVPDVPTEMKITIGAVIEDQLSDA